MIQFPPYLSPSSVRREGDKSGEGYFPSPWILWFNAITNAINEDITSEAGGGSGVVVGPGLPPDVVVGSVLLSGGVGADPFWGNVLAGDFRVDGNLNIGGNVLGNVPVGDLNHGVLATDATVWRGDGTWAQGVTGTWTAAQFNGDVPVADLNGGAGASATTFWRGDGQWTNQLIGDLFANSFNGDVPVADLAGGVGASSTTFWRGDGTWSSAGTVTSVDVSGGTTGLTTSGGPIVGAGTITLAGILGVGSGGTGTATPGLVAGTNVTISGAWPNQTINSTGSGGGGTVTNVTGSGNIASSGGTTPNITFTGNLPIGNLAGGAGASATTFWRGDGQWASGGTVTNTGGALTLNQIILGNGGVDIKSLGSLGTNHTVLHGNALGAPSFSSIDLTADITGILGIPNGGNGTATPGFVSGTGISITGSWPNQVVNSTATGTVTNMGGALTLNQIMLGAGGVDSKVLGSLGTTTTVLHGNASGIPLFGPIVLTTDVSGNLPVGNLAGGAGAGVGTFWRGDGTWAAVSGASGGTVTNTGGSLTLGHVMVGAGGSDSKVDSVATLIAGALAGVTDFTTTGNTILGDATTDTLNVGNGGLIKDASGNVGIGGSPATATALHVPTVAANLGKWVAFAPNAGAVNPPVSRGLSIGWNHSGGASETNLVYGTSVGGSYLEFASWDGATYTERLRIDAGGNVGIGTTSPLNKLHVVATGVQALFEGSTQGAITLKKTGTAGISLYSPAAGNFSIYDNTAGGADRVLIDASGNVGIGGTPNAYGAGIIALTVNASTNAVLDFNMAGVRTGSIFAQASSFDIASLSDTGPMIFHTGSSLTARMKITQLGQMTLVSPMSFGYGTGAGGTVTQLTSKSTAVTLNTPTGHVIMHTQTVVAGTHVAFVLNNSTIGANDTVLVSPAAFPDYRAISYNVVTGAVNLDIVNLTGANLSVAVVLNFSVLRGSIN